MTDSHELPDTKNDAEAAAKAAFDVLTETPVPDQSPGPGVIPAKASTEARVPPIPTTPSAGPRPFSKTLDEADVIGDPGKITWAAGFGVPKPASRNGGNGRTESGKVSKLGKLRRGKSGAAEPGGVAPDLVRNAESVADGASDRSTRFKQVGIVAAVIIAAAMATLIVASAFRGPAREEARLQEESTLNGLGSGNDELPEPLPAGEEGAPPKTAPPSTAPGTSSPTASGSTGSGGSTVKTAPPSTSGSNPVTPVVTNGQQIVYLVSGLGLTFTTTSGNCSEFEGNPLCAHVGLEVGETLTISRVGDAEPATNIWLLDTTGALALKSESSGSYVFEAKAAVDKANIVIYADGVIPLFIDFAVAE